MGRWPRSRPVQILISLLASTAVAAIAFPAAEKYFVWYYNRDAGALHDGQTGLSVYVGAGATSVVVFSGMFLLLLIIQHVKIVGSSKHRSISN